MTPEHSADTPLNQAKRRASERAADGKIHIEGSIYEGMEACLTRDGRTIAHVIKYADALALASAERDQLAERIAEIIEEDGGCWRACSGCQESDEGHVSEKYYPYSPLFKCQPGSGCRECGGLGVCWEDGAYLASYGDDLATDEQRAERELLRAEIINSPETADFMAGVPLEATHQRERWGKDHDGGKTPFDWFWLIGYLAQKAADAATRGDAEKAMHHTISTAAALSNWHAALTGVDKRMRPGIEPPDEGSHR